MRYLSSTIFGTSNGSGVYSNPHLAGEELTMYRPTEWVPEGVPALKASATHGDTATYLCVLPGRLIADLYGRYGGRLLQSNVRSYLSNVGKVNRGIRETILSKPELFLPYNNGITATATAVELKDSSIIKMTDLQIVNGGQTTASPVYAGRDDGILHNSAMRMCRPSSSLSRQNLPNS